MTDEPSAVFFDLDGTILDWQTGMEETWLISITKHNDGSYDPADIQALVRKRRDWFWSHPDHASTGRMNLDEASRIIVRAAFEDAGLGKRETAESIADWYRAERAKAIAPYPGAIETLTAFRERGIRLALITNGEARNQRRSIDKLGIETLFDCIIIEGEFGVGKPDPRVFLHALETTNSEPDSTWMVGDYLDADIAPAVALGMHTVWVDEAGNGVPDDAPTRPHRVIRAISQLM